MYYRRGFYPRTGQADVPDDLWSEFQRIRGHLSNVDQNNVRQNTVRRDLIIKPTDIDHNGVSDIVGENGKFLYKEKGLLAELDILGDAEDRWYDLGRRGLVLRSQSRGDASWIVGASIDSFVGLAGATGPVPVDLPNASDRANVRLRIRCSQGGLSVAESVGGFNNYVSGCSIAVVATFLSKGGPIEFSPAISYTELVRMPGTTPASSWIGFLNQANIFAFALYR